MSKTSTTSYWVKRFHFCFVLRYFFVIMLLFSFVFTSFFGFYSLSAACFPRRKIIAVGFNFISLLFSCCVLLVKNLHLCVFVFALFPVAVAVCNGWLIGRIMTKGTLLRFRAEVPWDLFWQTVHGAFEIRLFFDRGNRQCENETTCLFFLGKLVSNLFCLLLCVSWIGEHWKRS